MIHPIQRLIGPGKYPQPMGLILGGGSGYPPAGLINVLEPGAAGLADQLSILSFKILRRSMGAVDKPAGAKVQAE